MFNIYFVFFPFLLITFLLLLAVYLSDAYDPLDPNGNITIKWDIISWTPDGYVVSILFYNNNHYEKQTGVIHYAWIFSFSFHWWLTIVFDECACSCQLSILG